MNRIFRIIWSQVLNTWIVVSELATRHGKRAGGAGGRSVAPGRVLEHDMVEDSHPATAWSLRAAILLSLLSLYAPAEAANRFWDFNGTAVGRGGTGTWDTASPFWSPNNDGVSGPYSAWNNAALDDAFFGGTAGTVTLGAPITVHNLNFEVGSNGYTVTGGTLTLAGAAPAITVGSVNDTATINSAIAGTVGLRKLGSGVLVLNGTNTYTGVTRIEAGGLTVNGNAALGAVGNNVIMFAGTTLTSAGSLLGRNVNLGFTGGTANIRGAGVGDARYQSTGGLNIGPGVAMTNNTNSYSGQTVFGGNGSFFFGSLRNVGGGNSALGAPTTATNGLIVVNPTDAGAVAIYTGGAASSDRDWQVISRFFGNSGITNAGTGTLTLTGNISGTYANGTFASRGTIFAAQTADLVLSGVISGSQPVLTFTGGGTNRTITLGGANTYTTNFSTNISNVTVKAGTLANTGVASSFGTSGGVGITNGVLSYTGAGASSDRAWALNNGTINNDGTGALSLSGSLALTNTGTFGGSYLGSDNLFSGVISGTGNVAMDGTGAWVLNGANTYTGTTTVSNGTLRARSTTAFGATSGAVVNGGTLDIHDLAITLPSLAGTGGAVDLGTGTLILNAPAATSTSYAGNITGSGGLTKNGASTQTLTGTNTYTGATTVNGGTLRLNFGAAGAPTSNIISSASALNMGGGTLSATGAAGVANTQTFNGLDVLAGNSNISATAGAGGSMTVNLGAINRTGGLINFNLPGSGNITTTNTTLGGWATVNGTDYAKVEGGNILAFVDSDYTDQDDASLWSSGQFISDSDGDPDSYFGTVGSSIQLGGLQFTTADATTTVTVAGGQTLGIDGTILVAPSVGANNQTITGGSITGTSGGGVLGIQQNGTGNFTIASQIVDNGGSIGFTKAGTGLVTLSNTNNIYTGATTVSQGILSVASIANGGAASSIGTSSAASSNLVLEGGTLRHTGGTTSSNRGFTLARSGAILSGGVDVTTAATNLTFSGLVTSADGAGLTKSGAGTLVLTNAGNDYTGITTVNGGTLAVDTLANGGLVSGIGASGSASGNLVLNGGTLSYTGGTTSIDRGFTVGTSGVGGSSGGIGVSNAATTLTMSGIAMGDDGFRKEGAGTLVLTGTNTYTGGTTVNGGALRAGSNQAFGIGNATTVASGATLDLAGFPATIGGLFGAGAVTLGGATLTSSGGNGSFSGVISGTGGYTRGGGFTTAQTMTGCNNTYTGVTSINSGILTVDCLANGSLASGIGASSNASSNLVFNTAVLRYGGGNVSIDRGLTAQGGPAAIEVTNAATTLGMSGTIVGAGFLRKDGPGTLVISGNNTYTGGTQVTGGTLRAGSATAFGTGGMTLDNTAGVLLDLGVGTTVAWLTGGGSTGGNINLGAQTLTIGTGNSTAGIAHAGNISGSGNLVKNGAQIQRLSGCNSTYTGTTIINGGALAVDCLTNGGSNSGIGASSVAASSLVLTGGTLSYTGAGNSSDRLFTLGTAGGTLDASGTGALQMTNAGVVAMTGTTARTFTLTGTNTGNNTFNAQLDNAGAGVTSLSKTGTGTWVLTNNSSSYTGVTNINGGVLGVSQLANGGVASGIGASSSAASNLVIGNGSTLRYTGAGDSTDRLFTLGTGVSFIESSGTGAINFTNTGAIVLSGTNTARTVALGGTNAGNNTLAATIADNGAGVTTLAKNDSGTWMLTGNNTYTGNTVINNGNLTIGNGGTAGNLGTGNVIVDSPTSTLSINRSDTVIFTATMSGPGAFAQIGTGTTTLTANNTIGAARVSAGTLDVNGVLNTSTIAMGGTSTLNVDGAVQAAGATTAVITGDAGASTINVNSGGTLRANGDLGDGSDAITLTGTLDTGVALLGLGASDDTLTLSDGASITGAGIDAGAGTADNMVVNNALALTMNTGFGGFERLTKQNTGVLTLAGSQAYSAGTAINGGTLDVDGTLDTTTLSMSDGTAVKVDGTVQGLGGVEATITGSAGANSIVVNAGATLRGNGDLGGGSDSLILAGTLSTASAALSLGAGDDSVILRDGIAFSGAGIDGGIGDDQLLLDNALVMVVGGNALAGFESLTKQNVGTAELFGNHNYTTNTSLVGGSVRVIGMLETPVVTMADNTVLLVNGGLQAAGGATATITGNAGANTVGVGAAGTLLASGDLGDGNDVLDVAGTLNTGAGAFNLGAGDDTLSIHDGTNIVGTVVAGAGNDTFNTDIATSADLGAVQGFETLSKTGVGALDVNGPMSSDFTTVNVLAGSLNVTAGGSVVAAPGTSLTTTVASGATLDVAGSYSGGALADSFTVAGTVSGSGTIVLGDGDDTLTLNDGAVLANTIDSGAGAGDTVVLNNANALTLDAGNTSNFELLRKDNGGTATLTGAQAFIGGAVLNGGTLSVAGTLEAPTVAMADNAALLVGGGLQAAGGATATITGSAGANTVGVGAAGTLLAIGDLGDGNDVLDVAGTLNTVAGAFNLGAGDDTLGIHDGTSIVGTVVAGTGNDTLNADIATIADLGAAQGFEALSKTGIGALTVNGPAASDFTTVDVLAGSLNVAASGNMSAEVTTIANGATLNLGGSYSGTAANDNLTVAGTVAGAGSLALLDGDDTFTIQDGANLSGLATAVDGGLGIDTLNADIAGIAILGGADNFETLVKSNTGTLGINGPASSVFDTVLVQGGTLAIASGAVVDPQTTVVSSGATLTVDGTYLGTPDADTFTVAGTVDGAGTIDLLDGDDVLTLNDGADLGGLTNPLDGGAHGAGDTVVLNNAGALVFDANQVVNFESLQKASSGVATLTGTGAFASTAIGAGTLDVDGTLNTAAIGLADGATLNVDGTVQAAAATPTAITGSAGTNTVAVGAGGSLLASGDLGDGADVLDVTGTLDTGAGAFVLGDGDDTFTVHDGTNLIGSVDGGAGLDTRVYDINLSADLGALATFEGLSKTGTGVLNILGPSPTDLQEISVLGGTLNVGPGANVVATTGGVLDTVVAAGATLHVEGSYGCGAGNDTMSVSGTVSGGGTIDLCGGEDILTLGDGAVLGATISGGTHGAGDTVVLDNANALTIDAGSTINFEFLRKDNAGDATLTGTQTFAGGTLLNAGTMNVAGLLETPTVAMADGTMFHVDGSVQGAAGGYATLSGSAGINTVTVATGATLKAAGDLGEGADMLDLAGTLDTGNGTFALGAGDDRLVVHESTAAIGTVDGGSGIDRLDANIGAGRIVPLGSMMGFESLAKSGGGALQISGPSEFIDVDLTGGLLEVTAGGSVAAQNTTVASGSTLRATGVYGGTAGDDRFTSSGTVSGTFSFGDGSDNADFIGGDLSGLTGFDGGAGSNDRVGFHGMNLDGGGITPIAGWERVELLDGSRLTLATPMALGGGLLSIDGSSQLTANAGASLNGNLANAGLITTGNTRFGLSGSYTGGGSLAVAVSPGGLTAGGLDIGGDVAGTTAVTFLGDGTEAPQQPASILVISNPNDNPATAGGFVAADAAGGVVRLNGSVFPWTLDQQAGGYYLNTGASDILPEIGGYAVLPSIGMAYVEENNRLLFERMSGIRGDAPRCGADGETSRRAYASLRGECHGVWVAATGSEKEMGADPGFEFSGDTVGVYVGADVLLQDRGTRTLRGGLFAGFQRGNYWSTGKNSTDLQATGEANVRVDMPVLGMYGSLTWRNDTYLDMTLVGQLPEATIAVEDGFNEEIRGNTLTASAQAGHRFHLSNGWTLEPQVLLAASAMQWQDKRDASGKQLAMDDDLVGTARAAVRAEKLFETMGGARVRPWATIGVQDTLGEKDDALVVIPIGPGAQAQAFPNHDLGVVATIDVGVEAELSESASLFGVLSYGESVDGSDAEYRQANLGVRIRW